MDIEGIKERAKSNVPWRPGASKEMIRANHQIIKLCDTVSRYKGFEKKVNSIMLVARGPVGPALLKALAELENSK